MGACDEWEVSLHGGPCGKNLYEAENLRYRVKNGTAGENATIAALTNDIIYPPQCTSEKSQFAYADYTLDWASNPAEAVFLVPADSECTQAGFAAHPSLRELVRR